MPIFLSDKLSVYIRGFRLGGVVCKSDNINVRQYFDAPKFSAANIYLLIGLCLHVSHSRKTLKLIMHTLYTERTSGNVDRIPLYSSTYRISPCIMRCFFLAIHVTKRHLVLYIDVEFNTIF